MQGERHLSESPIFPFTSHHPLPTAGSVDPLELIKEDFKDEEVEPALSSIGRLPMIGSNHLLYTSDLQYSIT